jgi:hypothetical protein
MSINEQPSYYAIIPANVRYDNDLKPNEKLLYGEITCLSQSTGKCFASNEYFANLYGTSKETVSRWVSNLSKKGYVKTQLIYKDGTKQIINRYIQINQEGIDKKINSPIDEKVKDNITRVNNTSIKEKINKKENLFENLIIENEHYDIYEDIANDFILHRKQIKKPLRTTAPIKAFIDALVELSKIGYSFDYCIEQMKANEWQTIKIDYIHKPQKQNNYKPQKSKDQIRREQIDKHFADLYPESDTDFDFDAEIVG